MISSGLFVLPGLAFARAGPGVFISYLLAGLAALTTVLSLSELITAMPKAGGDYFYVSRAFGQLYGTVSGILSWLALSFKSGFAIFGIAELLYLTFGFELRLSALVLVFVFTLLNLLGVREALRFQVALVTALILIMLVFTAAGMQEIMLSRFRPFLGDSGLNGILSTAGFVFVSFGGVLTTASIAGEVKNPARNITAGLIGSTVAVTLLYTLTTLIVVGVVPSANLRDSLAPVALAARNVGGMPLYAAIMAASLLAFVTTANGGILTASRYPVALAKDRMLPAVFEGKDRSTHSSPRLAIVSTGGLIAAALLLDIDTLIKAASTVILLSNIFAHLSVIVMRESRIRNYLPTYKSPGYPWLQIAGILVFVLLIIDMGVEPILFSLLFMAIGATLYFIRRDKSDETSPAMLHLIQRIGNKAIVSDKLPNELREIVIEREMIEQDDFDHAVANAVLLEIEEDSDLDSLWKLVANHLEPVLTDLSADETERLLREREAESSTAINQFVAIPHIVVDGTGVFRLAIIRARDGLDFGGGNNDVKAVFVLIGSLDMRRAHLRALAAVAQLVQQADFEELWLKTEELAGLRDMLLLSPRQRK